MFTKPADDERDLVFGDLGFLPVRPETLDVEVSECLPRQLQPVLARHIARVAGQHGLTHAAIISQRTIP